MSAAGWVGNTFYGDLDSLRIEVDSLRVERDTLTRQLTELRSAVVDAENFHGSTIHNALMALIPAKCWEETAMSATDSSLSRLEVSVTVEPPRTWQHRTRPQAHWWVAVRLESEDVDADPWWFDFDTKSEADELAATLRAAMRAVADPSERLAPREEGKQQ